MSIRLLIVEADTEACDAYLKLLELHPALELVDIVDSQNKGVRVQQESRVDAIVVSLELALQEDMALLKNWCSMSTGKPFVVMVSHISSKKLEADLRRLGVDHICDRNDAHFSYDKPLSVAELVLSYGNWQLDQDATSHSEAIMDNREVYKRRIHRVFACLEFPEQQLGTKFCKEAVLFMAMNDGAELWITRDVYPYVANQYATTPQNVERLIRCSIEGVWLKKPLHVIHMFYPFYWNENMGRPTNGDFIRYMSERIVRNA